jgi:hypothetical protein
MRSRSGLPAIGTVAGLLATALAMPVGGVRAQELPEPAIPPRHPYLALTQDDIARAHARAEALPWARRALDECASSADAAMDEPLLPLPEQGDTKHWDIAARLFTVARAHAFTGEPRYAEWVRDGLVAYADIYPGLAMTNRRCKLFTQSSLYEAIFAVAVAQAYDLVADSGALSDAERAHIEGDLLRPLVACFKVDDLANDPRIEDLHYRCYNFQAWHIAAVGLIGLAIGDADFVRYALDSPYGYRHLIAHDINDDGIFWERSVGYHRFVLNALLPLTEAMLHCGVDLYALRVPCDRARGEGPHYVTDTSDADKSLRLMFEAPFYLMFGDTSYMGMGDSGSGPQGAEWVDLIGYHRYRDAKLAWLLNRDVPLTGGEVTRGRVGFLHYYRHSYRYEGVRLDGEPVSWARHDAGYEIGDDAVTIDDGGMGQPDRYLLSDTDAGDFTLEWTMTRLADRGGEDRSWLVFHTDARDPANRKSFLLVPFCPEVGRAYRFRLEVGGDTCRLLRDGEVVATEPTVYARTPGWQWLIYDAPEPPGRAAPLDLPEGTFANTGRHENGCSLFPSTGVAILRQSAGPLTARPESTAVALSYGPYGGGHGHPDKLTIGLYALGRQWLPSFPSMPYETHWKAEWTAQTVSHNTLVIDGISQQPTGERDVQWPVDDAEHPVIGRLIDFAPESRRVSAECDSAYDGFVLRREVGLLGSCVVDALSAAPSAGAAAGEHRFDAVLHIDGDLVESTVALTPAAGPLGEHCGYQYVEQVETATIEEPGSFTYAAGHERLRVWVLPTGGAPITAIVATGLTDSPTGRMPMLILRMVADRATYVTVLEPVDPADPVTDVALERDAAGAITGVSVERASGRQVAPVQVEGAAGATR